jgi:hypothetical protein
MQIFKNIHFTAAILLAGIILGGCTKENITPKPSTVSAGNEEMVITPAGLMQKSKVHFIEPGNELQVVGGRLQKIESMSGRTLEDYGEVTINKDPIHFGNDANYADIVPRTVNGWAAYAYWTNTRTSNPITSFTTDWVVPAVPKLASSQTIFLFNGMQDGTTASSYIIQPVLQWGPSAAGGGKYWAVTNWYVSSKQAFFGSLETVGSGTSLQGVMTETGTTGSNYNYYSSFAGYPSASSLKVSNVPEAFWAAETLEVYGVSRSTEYPNQTSMPFSSIQILQGNINATISWTGVAATGSSLPKAVIGTNSSPGGLVTIDF